MECERPGDGNALALPAGKLAGPPIDRVTGQPDRIEQFTHSGVGVGFGDLPRGQRLGQNLTHRHRRIQRRVRILEDNLDVLADVAPFPPRCVTDLPTIKLYGSGGDRGKAEHRPAERGFARTGLADEADSFIRPDVDRDVMNRSESLVPQPAAGIGDFHASDVEQAHRSLPASEGAA